jgi:hypothetical protein
VVDDDTIVTENAMRGIVAGQLAQRGYTIDDLDGHYLVTNRTVILWVFDESCALVGEAAARAATSPTSGEYPTTSSRQYRR